MTAFPDTKAREKLTMLKCLLIITNIWYFVCITVAAMVLNFKLLNLVMNFKKKKSEVKHITCTSQKRSQLATPKIHWEELQKLHNVVVSNQIKVLFNLNIVTQNQRSIPSEELIQLDKNLHKVSANKKTFPESSSKLEKKSQSILLLLFSF